MYKKAALIAGVFAMAIALWFLGWLVVSINVLPLWIVIGATIGMMLYDFYQAMKEESPSQNGNGA